jgi:ATP-binding cassette subfamily C (CFTR/MRP) protein 1
MRQNLDPEGIAKDEEIWQALEHSRLKDHVESMEGGLNAAVGE